MRLGHIKETVRLKMQEQSPSLFRRLKAAGTLEATLEEMAEDLKDQVVHAAVTAGNDPKVVDKGLERLQAMDAAGRQMREILLSELEFPDDEPTNTCDHT